MSCWDTCLKGPEGDVATLQCFECIVENLLRHAVRLGGVVAFVFLVIGGFKWLTAGGDAKKVESAKQTLTYAVAGVVLLVLIWFIMLFIENFTGVDVTNFSIGG